MEAASAPCSASAGAPRPDFRAVNAKRGGADVECRIVADVFWDIFRAQRSRSPPTVLPGSGDGAGGPPATATPTATPAATSAGSASEAMGAHTVAASDSANAPPKKRAKQGEAVTAQDQKPKQQKKQKKKKKSGEATIVVTSALGVQRTLTRNALAALVVDAVLPALRDAALYAYRDGGESGTVSGAGGSGAAGALDALGGWRVAGVRAAPGSSGWLWLTTREHVAQQAREGRVACTTCGTFVSASTGGMAWHMKNSHGTTSHSDAHSASVAASQAMLLWQSPAEILFGARGGGGSGGGDRSVGGGGGARLQPADMAAAQRSPAALRVALAEGRVKPLEHGMELCRSGDVAALETLVAAGEWDPRAVVDRHGSTALMWAAGGGHLACCQFLVDVCGLDPGRGTSGAKARRGYVGRTPLHWAARNGHLDVVQWLVHESAARGAAGEVGGDGADGVAFVNRGTADGTTALCWAAWQGHTVVCRFLVSAGADAMVTNSYGCTAAMWACQGAHDGGESGRGGGAKAEPLVLHRYLLGLGLDFSRINANGQGCLHKAAQRGCTAVCEWLLSSEVALDDSAVVAMLGPNSAEGSRPSALARYAGHADLARWLETKEAAAVGGNGAEAV